MTQNNSDILVLDSNLRSSGSVSSAVYNCITAGLQPEGTWEVIDYSSSNQLYNVEVGVNDQLHWAEPGALTATLPAGNYTQASLNAAAKVVMDAASGSTFTFTVSADTGVVTVAIAAGTFNWEFGTVTTRRANYLLGLSPVDTLAAASLVGDLVPALRLHTHILVRIGEDGTKNVTALDGQEYSALIPLTGSFGEDLQGRKLINYQQSVFFSNITSFLTVSLFSEDGVALVNTPRYVLSLRKLF